MSKICVTLPLLAGNFWQHTQADVNLTLVRQLQKRLICQSYE